jgi:hypothetical protein
MDVSDLTPEVLRHLYTDLLLTEKEIAEKFGTYQVKVGRLRRKWGIPTLGKTGRLEARLPDLTPLQEEILLGSLLGDGHMHPTSTESARFMERHSLAQEDYLKWKVAHLAPFVSSTYPETKTVNGKVYPLVGAATHSCPQLRPLYDLFYTTRGRVFPKDLHERITPLALAVWYMDDGSLAGRGLHPRISVGLSQRSLRRAAKALRALGLKPRYHDEGAFYFPGQADRFFGLVREHIPPCMAYKLPRESERRDQDTRARDLTLERAQELYEGGLSLTEIASLYDVSRSTVHRRLQAVGAPRRRMGRPTKSYSVLGAEVFLGNYDPEAWSTLPTQEQDRWVDEVYEVLTKTPFPYPDLPEGYLDAVARMRERSPRREGDTLMPLSRAGLGVCYPFFPNRYKARYGTRISAYEAWHDEKHLRRAICFQLKVGDPVTPRRVLRAVTANCRTPTAFRPTVAQYVYSTYCPPGGKVWDPCAGYGGRVLGAHVAGVRYVGTDVEPETIEGNRKLAEALGSDASLVLSPAEDFDPGAVDLVFTSPPYFDREHYSGRDAQSWVRYETQDAWVEGFLRPVVRTAYKALPLGGHLVLNIADIRKKGATIPLVDLTCTVAVEEGFTHKDTLLMPLSKLNANRPSEPVLVFTRG